MSKKKKKEKSRKKTKTKTKNPSKTDRCKNNDKRSADQTHPMELLASLLWKFPDLPEELLGMLSMLDEGEEVDLAGLDNTQIRDTLSDLLSALKLQKEGEYTFHWTKSHSLLKTVACLMDACKLRLASSPAPIPLAEITKGFMELSEKKNGGVDAASKAHRLLVQYADTSARNKKEVSCEVLELLVHLFSGESVNLDALKDPKASQFLKELLCTLGMLEGKEGFECPESPSQTRETTKVFQKVLEDESRSDSDKEEGPMPAVAVGPMRPSFEQLAQAQEMMANVPVAESSSANSSEWSSSSEDSDAGPMIAEKSHRVGKIDHEKEEEIQRVKRERDEEAWDQVHGRKRKQKRKSQPLEREEWMMTPGEAKGIGNIMPSARTFKSKGPRSEAPAAAPLSKLAQEDRKEMESLMAKHREARGKSLVEKHQEASAETAVQTKGQSDRPASAKIGFDRASLMESRSRTLNPDQASQLIEKARMLDSKFSRSVERSFL